MSSEVAPRPETLEAVFGSGIARAAQEGRYRIDQALDIKLDDSDRGVCNLTLARPDPNHRGLGMGEWQVLAQARVTFNPDGTIYKAERLA